MQRIYLELEGKKFNHLLIVSKAVSKRGKQGWKCLCDCGNEVIFETSTIITGNNLSCGKCLKLAYEDLTGQQIKHWIVISRVPIKGPSKWLCKCVCGSIREIWASNLRKNSFTGHCGCINKAKRTSEQLQRNELRVLRKTIIKRDNATCQLCKIASLQHRLKVHHIFPFKHYPNMRLDPKNLITLCSKCHVLAHNGNFNSINIKIQQLLTNMIKYQGLQ